MAASVSKTLLSILYALVLLTPLLKASKTVQLDLIDESHKLRDRGLVRRQVGDGWRSTEIIYNSTEYAFFVDVDVGDNNKNLRLGVIQNPFTWVANRWNSTLDCPPTTDAYTCGRVRGSGFFSLDPPDSSTYRNLSEDKFDFDITYRDNRYAYGKWGRDKVRLGQLTIDDVNFGVAEYYNATPALGLERSDSTTQYPTFLEVMQAQNIINTPTYGVYVGDIRGRQDSGKSITFGGIDTAKFERPLRTFSSRTEYALNLLSIEIVSGTGTPGPKPLDQPETSPIVAGLNFGTPSIHLPSEVFNVVMDDLGAEPSNNYDITVLPPDGSGLNFTFSGGFSIFVPYIQMIQQYPDSLWYTLLIVKNDRNTVLGTPFFRSAYVFYDFQNAEFSVASALYNVTASNVTEVGVNNASVTVNTWLYQKDELPPPPPPPPPTPTPTPTSTPGPKVPVAAIAGGAAGGVVAIAVIIGICYYCFSYRPRHRDADISPPPRMGEDHSPVEYRETMISPPPNYGSPNGQFSPQKAVQTSPLIGSPMSELGGASWDRDRQIPVHNARYPNIQELA